jgi:hypothetical protein
LPDMRVFGLHRAPALEASVLWRALSEGIERNGWRGHPDFIFRRIHYSFPSQFGYPTRRRESIVTHHRQRP